MHKINNKVTKKFEEYKKSLQKTKELTEKHWEIRDNMNIEAKKIEDILSLKENVETLLQMEGKINYYKNDYKDKNKAFYSFIDYFKNSSDASNTFFSAKIFNCF